MNDSLRWLRLYLGFAGAMILPEAFEIVMQTKATEHPTTGQLLLSLGFATLSVFCGLLMFLGAWLAPRLLRLNPNFLKGVILFRWTLALFGYGMFAVSGDFFRISLLIFWTGLSFFMTRMTGRLAAEAKAAESDGK